MTESDAEFLKLVERKDGTLIVDHMVERLLVIIRKQELDCNHPGCCCVCGHQGKCPEDGPTVW